MVTYLLHLSNYFHYSWRFKTPSPRTHTIWCLILLLFSHHIYQLVKVERNILCSNKIFILRSFSHSVTKKRSFSHISRLLVVVSWPRYNNNHPLTSISRNSQIPYLNFFRHFLLMCVVLFGIK